MNTYLTNTRESFLRLVRIGIGVTDITDISEISDKVDWVHLQDLADEHGLFDIVLDGLKRLPQTSLEDAKMPQLLWLEWIGEVLQDENIYKHQQMVAADLASLFHQNAIRMYALKGCVIAECYPKPEHRISADIDCYLTVDSLQLKVDGQVNSLKIVREDFDAWSSGNDLIRAKGFSVDTDFYKNSTFEISDVVVENHQYLTPFRGNNTLKNLEKFLQSMLKDDSLMFSDGSSNSEAAKLMAEVDNRKFEGTYLYRPPVMVSALFLIEHAFSHFLHEGLTWSMVLDWMMFSKKHQSEIDWNELNTRIDEFGFRKFYDCYYRLGQYLLGELRAESLEFRDCLMLKDVWAPLDLHETVRGWRGKLALAGNTWRARWKYRHFTNMNWITALWIQVKGFLFIKIPKLDL